MSFLSGRTSLTTVNSGNIAADAITSAKIADDAIDSEHYTDASVDLAHMSSQAVDEDNLHISNSGSNGNFLSKQSGDAGGLTWAAAGGGLTSISNTSITAATNLDITGFASGTYDNYEVWISNGQPGTDHVILEMETSTDGGTSFDTGGSDYTWGISRAGEDGILRDDGDPDDSEIQLTSIAGTGSGANEKCSFKINIFNPEEVEFTSFTWSGVTRDNNTFLEAVYGSGERQSAADVDGLRFHWASGDWVEQGKIQFLGIAQ